MLKSLFIGDTLDALSQTSVTESILQQNILFIIAFGYNCCSTEQWKVAEGI